MGQKKYVSFISEAKDLANQEKKKNQQNIDLRKSQNNEHDNIKTQTASS